MKTVSVDTEVVWIVMGCTVIDPLDDRMAVAHHPAR